MASEPKPLGTRPTGGRRHASDAYRGVMASQPAGPRFLTDFDARYGVVERVAPGIRRLLAENPSKYSGWGTGTYIVGGDAAAGGPGGPVAVIDPGPDLESHHAALDAALEGEDVAAILVTHTHADHSPASRRLAERTGAPRYGFGPHPPDADELAEVAGVATNDDSGGHPGGVAAGDTGGESEGGGEAHGDTAFVPDVVLRHGDVVGPDRHPGAHWRFEAIHTPGHISNHLCFAELDRGVLFSGDHVMGWSTTVVSPPAGDMGAYLASLELLLGRTEHTYYPTHGPEIVDPLPFVRSLLDHRLHRDRQLLEALAGGERSVAELVERIYADVRPELHAPARRSALAHLLRLAELGRVVEVGDRGGDGGRVFRIAPTSGHESR